MSEDFYNMFSACQLEDFRKVKEAKPDNIIYLMSYVSSFNHLFKNTKIY